MSQNIQLPPDHDARMKRVRLCLDGLSIGDGFGERFFFQSSIDTMIALRTVPRPPWHYTDDTVMAISICETLKEYGWIDQDDLASRFARRFHEDPGRGYGQTAIDILQEIHAGADWREVAGSVFGGQGSMGNGSAMRVAPVGAYFSDDPDAVVRNAAASAQVTHAHPDAALGAIAIALATSYACRTAHMSEEFSAEGMVDFVLQRMSEGPTTDGIRRISEIPSGAVPRNVARVLGNGTQLLCSDTVPFCIWCAANYIDSYENAMWATVSGLGDRDTTCAIVGGIVAMFVGRSGIPEEWLANRETLDSV